MPVSTLKFWVLCCIISCLTLLLQDVRGQLSGDFTLNTGFYDHDERIGTNPPQALREHSSAESWLFLNYRVNQFHFTLRHDLFHNSPLLNPDEVYTEQGIPFFAASVDIDDLNITAGSFYDQLGSGILFRAFEERQIGIDNAMQGVRLQYNFTDKLSAKAFSGLQKRRFDRFNQVVTGGEVDYFHAGEIADRRFTWRTRGSVLNRTLDQATMDRIVNEINSYDLEERFIPKYNVYGFSGYSTIRYAGFRLGTEYAYKTEDVVRSPETDRLINSDGYALNTYLGYSQSGFGVTLRYKMSDHFIMRTNPYTAPEEGMLNFIPSFTKTHAYSLPARYGATNLEIGETGMQLDGTWTPVRNNTFNFNISSVEHFIHLPEFINNTYRLDNEKLLFRELYIDYQRTWSRSLSTTAGLQRLWYNQAVFEVKPGAEMVEAYTPFAEIRYRLNRRHSIRTELQYLFTDQDLGDFAYVQLEYNISPHWSFSVSNMINTRPANSDDDVIHFYSLFTSYRHKQSQFTLSYSKQPEGVVCTGGVCRVEPAFSGARFGVTTNF